MNLKKIAPFFLLLLLSTSCSADTSDTATIEQTRAEEAQVTETQVAETAEEAEATPGEFEFLTNIYKLSTVKDNGTGETANLYFAADESEEAWTTSVTLIEQPRVNNADQVVNAMKEAMLSVDPEMPYELWTEGDITGIEFIMFDEASSMFRYSTFAFSDNPDSPGLLGRNYSEVLSLEEVEFLIDNYEEATELVRGEIATTNFPSIVKE